ILLGLLSGGIGVVMIVVNLIRKKPIKKCGLMIIVGMVLTLSGGLMIETEKEEPKETANTEEETTESKKSEDGKKEEKENDVKADLKKDGEVDLDLSIEEREFTIGKSDKNFLDV